MKKFLMVLAMVTGVTVAAGCDSNMRCTDWGFVPRAHTAVGADGQMTTTITNDYVCLHWERIEPTSEPSAR